MAYGIAFEVTSRWDTGLVGTMTLTNASPASTNGWVIEFDAPFQITNLWNGEIVSHIGDHYVVRNAAWNGAVGPNASVSFGFQASNTGAVPQPSSYVVNGQPLDSLPESLPSLVIADVSLPEGDTGTRAAIFTVSLAKATTAPVTVSYATADGTATAGVDYGSLSGTLTFAPGETAKTLTVPIISDRLVELTETFTLNLSNVSGASITKAQVVGTIANDDTAARPTLSVADTSLAEGDPAGAPGGNDGFFRTQGNQIVDSAGQPVKIAGVNWFGMESNRYAPDGLHVRNYKDMMNQMAELGFNTIRLPFSNQLFDAGSTPGGIDTAKNPDLAGLSGMQILDQIVAYAGEIGLRIILDHHRSSAGAGASENGLWYNGTYNEQRWISDWVNLAQHYAGNPTVIGADLHNEPYNGTWGGGGASDWAAAAERAGNAILAKNPNWLIFIEGVAAYQGQHYWWGGNLMGVKDRPIHLAVANQLVYSAHDYPNSIYPQPWFYDSAFPSNLPAKFDQMWGYIYKQNIAPVFIGEFGSRLTDPKDVAWLSTITAYLNGDFDANGTRDIPIGQEGISWTWWSWNPNSGDTGGILADDWSSVLENKATLLRPMMFSLGNEGPPRVTDGVTQAEFVVSLSDVATEPVTVAYNTVPGAALAGEDFTPISGTVTFAPGETIKIIKVPVIGDATQEPDEAFQLVLSDPTNADLVRTIAVATILNDDGAIVLPPAPPPTAGSLDASTTVTDDWATGSILSVAIKNAGGTTVDGWSLTLKTPVEISNIWNAEIASHTGETYVIRNTAWNQSIAAGQEVTFGFQTVSSVADTSLDWTI